MSINDTVQKNQYWEQFSLLPVDLDHLVNYLVESERPQTLEELAYELVRYRHQQTLDLVNEAFSQGRIYRPGESYEVGERLIFPHLNNASGAVQSIRPGRNPEYEPFDVVLVAMDEGEEREFAAELSIEHPLNTADYMADTDVSMDDLFVVYGGKVKQQLIANLETNSQFITVGDRWFLRELVMDISPGQLNIAEALLDMHEGGPLPTVELVKEMDLPAEIPEPLQLFSLEYALLHDNRFDEVGPAGKAMWFLRRMEPKEVLEIPTMLRYVPIPYNRGLLNDVMLSLEAQASDEWSDDIILDGDVGKTVSIVLTYPHWRSGTLPLAARVASLFPTAHITDRIRFSFVDGETGEKFPGWVVRSNRYVYGLADWYTSQEIQVGSYIDLEQGENPGTIVVHARTMRSQRREWLRSASVEDGRLYLEVTRVPVLCEYDELAAVAVSDPASIDNLAEQQKREPLETLLEQVFGGLAGLSLQRAVHALTLYSVVNLLRRVPPAPMLTVLATSSRYVSLGDNYWAYRGED